MTGLVTSKRTTSATGTPFGVAILLGAFLLFQVQPLIAKLILPWFGGSAAVWAACMLFFQVALLGGYAWAHWLSRQPPRRQKAVYLALLGLSVLWLPILPSERWKPGPTQDPLWMILGLLAATIGLPYFLLSSTSPLLQSWHAARRPGVMEKPASRSDAKDSPATYRLFAISNAGCMIGLLSYPVLVEPYLTNRQQAWMWSIGYCGFIAIAAVAALCGVNQAVVGEARARTAVPARLEARARGDHGTKTAARPSLAERLVWIALAACASGLLLAITNHLTQNIAAMPFLWVAPLSLYLLSLILCFAGDRWYPRSYFAGLGAVAMPVMAYAISGNGIIAGGNIAEPKAAIAVICATVFVLFMICHGELARRRPSPEFLTTFYLMVSAGGAIGGVFIGFAAPYLFNALYDPMIVLALTGFLLVWLFRPDRLAGIPTRLAGISTRLIAMGVLISYCELLLARYGPVMMVAAALLAVCVFRVSRGNENAALYAMAVGLTAGIAGYLSQDTFASVAGARIMARNFYGALAVYDQPSGGGTSGGGISGTNLGPVRVLRHGVIEHGEQFLNPAYEGLPTTYYARQSGIGLAIQALMTQGAVNVGVIGLGAGTLATYARPNDRYTFYEINPLVVKIAQSEFTFLRHCAARPAIIPGDARLALERERDRQFDILAVDAFSGDTIPVHLLTREAFQLYWRHLKPDGVLAVHVSSRYLSLGPVVAMGAAENRKRAMMIAYRGDPAKNESRSDWVLVTSRPGFFERPEFLASARPIPAIAGLGMWTDDYSNLYRVLR